MSKNIDKFIVKETPKAFSNKVKAFAKSSNCSLFDALKHLMDEEKYDPEQVAKMISPSLKAELMLEGRKLHLLKKEASLL